MKNAKTLSALILERFPNLKEQAIKLDTYSILRKNLKKISIEEEYHYVAEGDLLLDEDELALHAIQLDIRNRVKGIDYLNHQSELLGILNQGKIVRWKPGQVLTYCVLKSTFNSEKDYKIVSKNMKAATKDWENTCGIKFKHVSSLDNSKSSRPNGVVFPVRGFDSSGSFIASAFFPTYPKFRRRILIDPSYFTTRFNKIGVIRHELGHVLGLLHEHIRSGAPAVCPDENLNDSIDLTEYDPKSVMHYFCGKVGTLKLAISDLDIKGSRKLYGPPLKNFEFIDINED